MSDVAVEATETADDPTLRTEVELGAGNDEISYSRGLRINSIAIKGMRNKPVPLRRVSWEEIQSISRFARDIPRVFAVEYRLHRVRLAPAARIGLTLIVSASSAVTPGNGPADVTEKALPSPAP